jgi:Mrp family chromosome partitioning ATPase
VAQTVKDAKAIIVTTPQELSLADVRKSINFCKTVNMQVYGLIENMSGFICPHCGETLPLFGSGGGEKTALAMDVPFLGRIPFDNQMVTCCDDGISYRKRHKDSPVTAAFDRIADQMGTLIS